MSQPRLSSEAFDVGSVPDDVSADIEFDPALARARPVPRINIECFADDAEFARAIEQAAEDRRLSKVNVTCIPGGLTAALDHYIANPTPDLVILNSGLGQEALLAQLDALAEHCDAGTKVIICGRNNDVILYRELLKRGVSEYLVAPVRPIQIIESISNLYNDTDAAPIGNVIAFVGAKGGVGASTVCHNVAWCLAEQLRASAVIVDFDMAFGTTGLDFNQDPVQGIADALSAPDRLDDVLLDRLLTKCSPQLSLFAAPVALDREWDLDPDACETIIGVVRRNFPLVAVDMPHQWNAWSKRLLLQADEIVIVAEADLANLRNVKNLVDILKQSRRLDAKPRLVINKVGMPKRPEIPIKDFCQSVDLQPLATIDFDAESFGQAANNGQMVEEVNKKVRAVSQFREIARVVSHRKEARVVAEKPASPVASLLEKLKLNF